MPVLDNAKALFDEWYFGRLDNEDMLRSPHSKRLDTYAHKFMTLLAINEGKPAVDLPIMEKVIKLVNWQFKIRHGYSLSSSNLIRQPS